MNFASQCGEDKWIEHNWHWLGLPETGFFVEFGAGDGLYLSNTLWLEKDHGWSGLLVEPDPRSKISETRDKSNRINALIGPAGKTRFGLHPTMAYLSGCHRQTPESLELDAIPLSDLLRRLEIPKVDLISIDTEGNELECWRTLDLNIWKPTVAIIELYTWGLPDRSREVIQGMEHDGYELVHRTDLNGIFRPRKIPVRN